MARMADNRSFVKSLSFCARFVNTFIVLVSTGNQDFSCNLALFVMDRETDLDFLYHQITTIRSSIYKGLTLIDKVGD